MCRSITLSPSLRGAPMQAGISGWHTLIATAAAAPMALPKLASPSNSSAVLALRWFHRLVFRRPVDGLLFSPLRLVNRSLLKRRLQAHRLAVTYQRLGGLDGQVINLPVE